MTQYEALVDRIAGDPRLAARLRKAERPYRFGRRMCVACYGGNAWPRKRYGHAMLCETCHDAAEQVRHVLDAREARAVLDTYVTYVKSSIQMEVNLPRYSVRLSNVSI